MENVKKTSNNNENRNFAIILISETVDLMTTNNWAIKNG